MNAARVALELSPLLVSPTLVAEACAWSAQMALSGALSHGAFNEVVHMSTQPDRAFVAWAASAAHQALLTTADPNVTHIGCGTVRAEHHDGTVRYWSTCRMG